MLIYWRVPYFETKTKCLIFGARMMQGFVVFWFLLGCDRDRKVCDFQNSLTILGSLNRFEDPYDLVGGLEHVVFSMIYGLCFKTSLIVLIYDVINHF